MSLFSVREGRRARRTERDQERARAAESGRHRSPEQDGPREVVNIAWRPAPRERREPGGWGMYAGRAGVIALGAVMGYVSYWTQREMVLGIKHDLLVASLEAAGPDLGAFIFAALGHVRARRGKRALVLRLLSIACVGLAVGMNVLAVGTGDLGRLAVAVLPPLLYAAASDRLIAEVADQHGTDDVTTDDRSAWLVLLRWAIGPWSAWCALRRWVLDHVSPSPGPSAVELRAAEEIARADASVREAREWAEAEVGHAHARLNETAQTRDQEIAQLRGQLAAATAAAELTGLTKKETLLRLYKRLREAGDPRYGKREHVAEIAAELAPQAGDLHVKTAENYLRAFLDGEEAPQINGREHRSEGDMIGVTG